MTLAIFNSVTTPIEIAFTPESFKKVSWVAIIGIIDAIFVIDIVLNFRTTYNNPRTGDEVASPKQIA